MRQQRLAHGLEGQSRSTYKDSRRAIKRGLDGGLALLGTRHIVSSISWFEILEKMVTEEIRIGGAKAGTEGIFRGGGGAAADAMALSLRPCYLLNKFGEFLTLKSAISKWTFPTPKVQTGQIDREMNAGPYKS